MSKLHLSNWIHQMRRFQVFLVIYPKASETCISTFKACFSWKPHDTNLITMMRNLWKSQNILIFRFLDPHQGLRNCVCQCHHVLQGSCAMLWCLEFVKLQKDSKSKSKWPKYQVKDCVSAVANVDDYGGSARLLAATTLRNILGTKTLGDILSDRESIAR